MEQVFWGKNEEGNIPAQSDIIMIVINVSPKTIEC